MFSKPADYKESDLGFITSIKCYIYVTMLNLIMSPIFRFFILLTVVMLTNIFFATDSVYCIEDTINNAPSSTTNTMNSTQQEGPLSSGIHLSKSLEDINHNSTVDIAAKTAAAVTETVIKNAPWAEIFGSYTTVKTVTEVYKATPGSAITKASAGLGVGLVTGAFIYSQGGGAHSNNILPPTPNRDSADTNNPFIHSPA